MIRPLLAAAFVSSLAVVGLRAYKAGIQITGIEAIRGPEWNLLILRTNRAARLTLDGAAPRFEDPEARVSAFEVPAWGASFQVGTGFAGPLYQVPTANLEPLETRPTSQRYDPGGDLLLRFPSPPLGRLQVWRSDHDPILALDEGEHQVLPLTPGPPAMVLLELGASSYPWFERADPVDPEGRVEDLILRVGARPAEGWVEGTGYGPAAGRRVRQRLDEAGVPAVLDEVGVYLAARLQDDARPLDPEVRAQVLRTLNTLAFLDRFLVSAGVASPLELDDLGLTAAACRQAFFHGRPAQGAHALHYLPQQDYFRLEGLEFPSGGVDPTFIFAPHSMDRSLRRPGDADEDLWLGIYSLHWYDRYYARVRIGDADPWLVADDPRIDRLAALSRERKQGRLHPKVGPEKRLLEVRIPGLDLPDEVPLHITLHAFSHIEEVREPWTIVQGLHLRRPGDPMPELVVIDR